MIFAIDVRRDICKKYSELEELIGIRVRIKRFIEDEGDKSIRAQMIDAFDCLDKLINLRQEELRTIIDSFEKDFVNDVLENTDFYMMRRNH